MSSSAYAQPAALPIDQPSPAEETAALEARIASVEAFFKQPRFASLSRSYSAASVASKQGTLPPLPLPSTLLADKLFAVFDRAAKEGRPVHTLGAVDPVQMSQMARWLEVMYVSGWAASSLLTTGNNEVGPDLGDYPYTTVPNQVHRLFRAQQLHDKKHLDARLEATPEELKKLPYIDYLRPIIADADTGHGGTSAVMKLVKLFAESGASAIHLEDQLHGGKKCGHLSGKVVVPTSAHITRLIAARFQLDLLQHTMLLIARTDAESARLLSSTVDARDHPYIRGVPASFPDGSRRLSLAETLDRAEAAGKSGVAIDQLELDWFAGVKLTTFDEAVEEAIDVSNLTGERKAAAFREYRTAVKGKTNSEARDIAADILGAQVDWDWDLPRTREGYYHTTGGIEAAISRALEFAPYADMIWLETKEPNLKQAQSFARRIREKFPGKWLVYNLSPSFNWSAHGFSEADLKAFVWELAKEGFVLQLVSLAGLHSNALGFAELAQNYKTDGMLAYVEKVQRKEKELGVDVLTHQKWSGADYIDRILSTVSSGSSSTSSKGKDSTEHDF
ncbi:isocitrate lyase and phosphorylmutase [Auriscalpium vulgare]|uniref:Isocitrate lyase and phosphorylmutase n=1 Tax=Auriscalpium vulgare TaxID=40419 RepID=A0ACB8RZG9_9AGAM|nr:isocitrate lyase and phosphorylmutase [Auriscalpium vulgare]